MQAVILCGGEGSRLRPLTEKTPKPLIKILGEPVIVRLLRELKASGFDRATLCTRYLAGELKKALGRVCEGVELEYSREEFPLGTAGCVRAAYRGDDALILSGDGVSGFDYKKIIERHRETGADITIVAREVDDPREYGLMTAKDGVITGFIEKPGYEDCLTDLANTGCYVINREIIETIPENSEVDFAKDVFPYALREGKKLCAFEDRTFWYDIGDIPSLLECQRDMLDRAGIRNKISGTARLSSGSTVSYTVMEEGSALGGGSRAVSSLICENSAVAGNAELSEAVVGKNCTVGSGLIMKKNSVIGDGCVIGSDVTVLEGVRIASGQKIPDGAVVRTDVTASGCGELFFSEHGTAEGICDPLEIIRFAEAAATALGIRAAVLGGDGESFELMSLGFRSAGADVYDLRGSSPGEAVFAARRLNCKYAALSGEQPRIFSPYTFELTRAEERKTEQSYRRFEQKKTSRGRLISAESESALYLEMLRNIFPEKPKIRIRLKTDSPREAEIFSGTVREGEGEEVIFSIASDGKTVFAQTEDAVIPYENLIILACKAEFDKGRGVTLEPRAPLACDALAESAKVKISRAPDRSSPLSLFCCDPMTLIAMITRYLTDRGESMTFAADKLPKVIYTRRLIEVPEGLPKIMGGSFRDITAGKDVEVENSGARGYIRPTKSGKSVRLYIESVSAEAASELSADVARKLRSRLPE